tara:strand:- start:359 stop:529 length:171 start_codon:yes stop_codon:yes gene_type:complete
MGYIFDIKYNKESFMIKILTLFGFGMSYGIDENESTSTITISIWKYYVFLTLGYID